LIAAAIVCALPAAATARVLHAESVLAPGQSGFVSVGGVTSGTGSPHLLDQTELFKTFNYKSAMFGQPGTTEHPHAGVTVTRDNYGVPTIDGDSDYDAWWGVGYAVAQDRLFQLEAFRRATSGTLAEINGTGSLRDDVTNRRDYYTDDEIQKQINALPQSLMPRFKGYRDGINAWVAHVEGPGIAELPGEFPATLASPPHWTLRDSARVGVFLARTVPSSNGAEIEDAAALDQLGPDQFDKLLPTRTPGRISTVPAEDGRFPSNPGTSQAQERRAFKKSAEFTRGLGLPSDPDANAGTLPIPPAAIKLSSTQLKPFPGGGSFMWTISDGNRAYLYNGPQLGFSIPELFVEFEVHSPSQDVRGVSAAGIPVVGIGHNKHLAWGLTSGLTDDNDLYAEKLTGPETYMYKGKERQMDCRNEQFGAREPVTSLLGLLDTPQVKPLLEFTTQRICRTVHGPVQARVGGYAYARRYAVWGKEMKSIVGLSDLNDANTVKQAGRAVDEVTWNENVMAADDRGNIGYWHPGLLPLRPRGYDNRLPYPGTGQAEWRGFLKPQDRPHVINPEQGWLANWNNVPSQDWTNGDGEARERLSGPFHRVAFLGAQVSKVARHPSFKSSTNIVKTTGTTAQQFPQSRGLLRDAEAKASGLGRTALAQLLRWDGNYARVKADGTIDPGAAIWEGFKDEVDQIVQGKFGPGASLLDGGGSNSHMYDIRSLEAYGLQHLSASQLATAAERAAGHLRERFGSADPAKWRDPRRLYKLSAQGAGQAPPLPFFDRGTWNQSVELGR
jgi:penicillin amidase